ncbi:hypothetical protein NKI59_26885 [Mesorhizobium sp. M0598]|uniref:hypothetical protein n=1 Tax=Mesorhizobium sp. M0598 TaxID=2956968 RepID=UPI0033389043
MVALATPILQVSSNPALGLEVVDRNGAVFTWLAPGLPLGLNFDFAPRATVISLDVRRAKARHRPAAPAGPKLNWADRFRHKITPPASFGPIQTLTIATLDAGVSGYELLARPDTGALFLHADVLDTSSVSNTENAFIFQYAVANGLLQVVGPDVAHIGAMSWEALPGDPDSPLVLLLRQQDEHGYPLGIVTDDAVQLGTRVGVATTVHSASDVASWVSTNRANVIGPVTPLAGPLRVSGQMRSLSTPKLYDTFSDDTVAKNSLTKPWFVQSGLVPLDPITIPREIHGLSRGARLESKSARVQVGQAQVALVVEPAEPDVNGQPLFHHTHLELGEAGHWDIVVLREERDIKPGDNTSLATPQPVGAHRLIGIPGEGPFYLPAIDLPFAVANLSGRDRVNKAGLRLGDGRLPKAAKTRLDKDEAQFITLFEPPAIPAQRHVDGARLLPADRQQFGRLLDQLPTAATVEATGRIGPDLQGASSAALAAGTSSEPTYLLFGGDEGAVSNVVHQLRTEALHAGSIGGDAFKAFERSWRQFTADADVQGLRDAIGILPRPPVLDPGLAPKLLSAAIDYLRVSDNVADIVDDSDDAEALGDYLASVTPDEFVDEWTTPTPRFVLLLEHVWSPANYDLMRRIVRFAGSGALAEKLFGVRDLTQLAAFLDIPAEGLLQGVMQGVDALWEEVVDIYENGSEPILAALREKYGPRLTRDAYAKLLESAAQADADALLAVLNCYLSQPLRRLGDLSADPPEYILRTRRFPVARVANETLVDALWQQCFDLCAFATDKAWTFFLDDETTVLIKLSRKRPLSDILREVVRSYADAGRPDPLGIRPYAPPNTAPLDSSEIVERFITDLDADLTEPTWIGVVLLRPVADIHQDIVLRDLAGFDHITANYVAVGGRRPAVASPKPPHIDVWAHIFQQNPDGEDLPKDPGKIGDVKLALTKFDVRVRQSQLSAADIEVEIYPQDVWGRRQTPPKEFSTLTLHGTLQAPSGKPDGPKDLAFSAFFPTPFTLDIHLAFVKQLEFSRLSVARRNGSTSIDIDGELTVQKPQGLDVAIDFAEENLRLSLQNFRIQVPTLPGVKVEVGARRRLGFDLPALSFALPRPRAFNLFGIELVPTGLGYIRGNETDALRQFSSEYNWLTRLKLDAAPNNVFLSYMKFDVDFGKSPSFGLVDARGLRFSMALAVKVENNAPTAAYLGISGLDAKDLKLDLFGFLTLEVEELRISPAQLLQGTERPAPSKVNAGAILAEDLKLRIFNWSPTPPGSRLDLLMLHPTRDPGGSVEDNRRKGLLAYYDASMHPPSGGFFELYWMVLAHNMELPAKALNHLLEQNPGADDPKGLLDRLLDKPSESPDPSTPRQDLILRDVKLMDRESWLFGLSFKLGVLFERCSFVLHDQHYYGIRLWAPWVKSVFKQESIELAYIPGPTRAEDRFRTNLRVPALDMLGSLKSGEFALEWGVNWDFLIDIGFPWRTSIGYDWFRSFSIPVGCYEGKFGFYIEKKTLVVKDDQRITLAIGMGLYVGYYFGAGNSVAWVRAGIGVFAILEGRITLQGPAHSDPMALLKSSIYSIEIVGVIGVMAYGEGGIDVWILSASFRVSAQVAVSCTIRYVAGGPCALTYSAIMAAGYSASVRVGCGFCSWTFSVQGEVSMGVSGQLLLS